MPLIKQFKYPLLFFFSGFLFNLLGAWMKIMHYRFSDYVLTAGMIVQGLAVLLAIYILFRRK